MTPLFDKKNLKSWIVGRLMSDKINSFDIEEIKKAVKTAEDIMAFLEQYKLLHPEIK